MNEKVYLNWQDIHKYACDVCDVIRRLDYNWGEECFVYGIPRGGIHAALAIQPKLNNTIHKTTFKLTTNKSRADLFIDDIIDTGQTKQNYMAYHRPFFALIDYQDRHKDQKGTWIVFPWEQMTEESGPEENITRIIEYIGEDPNREGLKETPKRVVKSYDKLFGGYEQNPRDVLKVFEDGSCDELVLLKNIEFYSTCEHHMLPFYGKAHIAYIPKDKVIGISKLARILEIYSRRLQIQERIGEQVTTALMNELKPLGAACILEAQHFCMTSRGVEKQNSIMITSSLRGVFRGTIEARNELMSMIKD